MVLDLEGVHHGQAVAVLDGGRVEKVGHGRIAMIVVVLVGIVDGSEIVLHPGGQSGQPVILEHGQADRGVDVHHERFTGRRCRAGRDRPARPRGGRSRREGRRPDRPGAGLGRRPYRGGPRRGRVREDDLTAQRPGSSADRFPALINRRTQEQAHGLASWHECAQGYQGHDDHREQEESVPDQHHDNGHRHFRGLQALIPLL